MHFGQKGDFTNTGRAYNRTSLLGERREMMQRWADYCDELRTGVVRFENAAG